MQSPALSRDAPSIRRKLHRPHLVGCAQSPSSRPDAPFSPVQRKAPKTPPPLPCPGIHADDLLACRHRRANQPTDRAPPFACVPGVISLTRTESVAKNGDHRLHGLNPSAKQYRRIKRIRITRWFSSRGFAFFRFASILSTNET